MQLTYQRVDLILCKLILILKLRKKFLANTMICIQFLSMGIDGLGRGLDGFAPAHKRYLDLVDMLAQLRSMKQAGGLKTLNSPGFALKLGVNNPIIQQLRDRFNQLGYKISNLGGNTFDAEFDSVLRNFQAMNGLLVDGVIGTKSSVLRALNTPVADRIFQVELNMENCVGCQSS